MSAPTISPAQNSTTTTGLAFSPPGAGPLQNAGVGSTNRGLCTLSFQGRVFPFRTNPNEIWWSYELITHVEQTYGGRVVQLLGTRLGDLTVKVECGAGGWNYLMQTVQYLRDLLTDQRNGNTAVFEYTSRNWKLNVYSLVIPFEDQVDATVREITLNFKIQEDLTGVLSQISFDAELARLQDGVYGPGQQPHNKYNDFAAEAGATSNADPEGPGGPGSSPSGITNTVDSNPLGNNPGGLNVAGGLLGGVLPSIPGLGAI